MIVESRAEITKEAYEKLENNPSLIDKYGRTVATNSCFHPCGYGYYGSRILYDDSDNRYYLIWKRGDSCD